MIHCCRFVLAEESCFFEKQFRRPEFARSDNAIDLRSIEGATLQVAHRRIQCSRPHGHCCSIRLWSDGACCRGDLRYTLCRPLWDRYSQHTWRWRQIPLMRSSNAPTSYRWAVQAQLICQ